MNIKWSALVDVLGVGLLAGVGCVVLFSFALVGMSQIQMARERGDEQASGFLVAGVCLAACVVIVAYGLYLVAA